ncbi:EAL domain-containing protein [Frankia sp. CNm7]|uniref:EAL domain-containing protein n=2 Tax=Frankia nepalensis TaxID=1836974 RepID=A0A937UT11_9ACTN|nr:EAL domain-containing protein [Frankia nepalensis]MBL7510534.1 EAL domain-containing protein [Frankia nepalensis]MBL7521276.1 EAL domain-containing protein [Frankia nepalensis]MBL7629491.1 EAL domain-containing protein [Frankia nepalensis]
MAAASPRGGAVVAATTASPLALVAAGEAPSPPTITRSAAVVPLVAAFVTGMARLVTDDGGLLVVDAGAAGAGFAATGVAGAWAWRARATERAWLARLLLVLGAWTLIQAVRVAVGPASASGPGRAALAAGALAAPVLAAVALVVRPRPATRPAAQPVVVQPVVVQAAVATGGLTPGLAGAPGAQRRAGGPTPARDGAGAALGVRLASALTTARRKGWDVAGFDVHYQPIVRLSDGAVVGLEALARWTEPGRGPVPPLTFVTAAEAGGLVAALDEFVLGRACAEVATVVPVVAGAPPPRLHVNISATRLVDPALPDVFARALGVSGLDPARLVVEVTETSRIADLTVAARVLEAVRALGPAVAMDDVGAGHTTFEALHRLPVTVVKLDRGLIENPLGPERAARLGRSVITVARSLGAQVVAEGIERRTQRADLALLGCELGQGYLFARPAPLAALGPLLAAAFAGPGPAPVARTAGSRP